LEENRQRLELQNRQRMQEQQRRMEEQKQQQMLMMQRQAEERKKREELMQQQRQEQAAILNIRRVLMKFPKARSDTITALEQELVQVLQAELVASGSQAERVKQEAETALSQAKGRIQKEQEQKAELERQRKEALERAQEQLKQLCALIEAAEAGIKAAAEMAAPLTAQATDANAPAMSKSDIEAKAKVVEETCADAKAKSKACSDYILQHGSSMRIADVPPVPMPPVPGAPKSDDKPADEKPDGEAKLSLAKLVVRMNECNRLAESTSVSSKLGKDKALKKAVAKQTMEVSTQVFEKYSKSGMMSKKDVEKYAKTECKFKMPAEAIGELWKALALAETAGVPKEQFQKLRVAVGIAREKAKDMERKAARLEKEKKIAEAKARHQESIDEAGKEIEGADEQVTEAEQAATALATKAKEASSTELSKVVAEVEEAVKGAAEAVVAAKGVVGKLKDDCEDDLKVWMTGEQKKLEFKLQRADTRVAKARAQAAKAREDCKKKEQQELAAFEKQAIRMLRYHQKNKSLSVEELFDAVNSSKDGKVDEQQWLAFFSSCEKEPKADKNGDEAKEVPEDAEPSEDDLRRLFNSLANEEGGHISKEDLLSLVRVFMKVAKDTAMTSAMSIKESKTLRRLEEGEVIEVLQGPQEEETVQVTRVRAKAMKDDVEGWISVSGNNGTTFLEEGGDTFKVVADTILTEEFDLEGSADKEGAHKAKTTSRKLKVGELVHVRVWAKKEEKSGLMRMKCKCKADGATGWVTTVGNQGTVFLQVV